MRFLPFFVFLAGCASYGGIGLHAGVATGAEVRATMGEPGFVFQDAEGAATWAYSRGPTGYDTFMVHFDRAGKLAAIEPVMDEVHFRRVLRGMDEDSVRRILGPPGRVENFPRNSTLVWDYRFRDAWGYSSYFSVVFDATRHVKESLTWREMLNDKD
jgi:hypothetical protein